MSHVACSVRVCMLGTPVSCGKTVELIAMPFGDLTLMSPRNRVLNGGPNRMNPFAAVRGDKTAMRPLVKLLWTLGYLLSSLEIVIML